MAWDPGEPGINEVRSLVSLGLIFTLYLNSIRAVGEWRSIRKLSNAQSRGPWSWLLGDVTGIGSISRHGTMLPMLSRILVPCRLFGSLVSIASIANGFMRSPAMSRWLRC